jgi:hypothetical protein
MTIDGRRANIPLAAAHNMTTWLSSLTEHEAAVTWIWKGMGVPLVSEEQAMSLPAVTTPGKLLTLAD